MQGHAVQLAAVKGLKAEKRRVVGYENLATISYEYYTIDFIFGIRSVSGALTLRWKHRSMLAEDSSV